jgi:hypothetical protein
MSNEDKQLLLAIRLEIHKAQMIQEQFKKDMEKSFAAITSLTNTK